MPNREAKDFTEEEKTRVIAAAKATSFKKAAEEFGLTRNVIKHWVAQRRPATDRKSSEDFTKNEKMAIVKYADEVGFTKAAEENSISRQMVVAWKKRFKGVLPQVLLDENSTDITEKNQPTIQKPMLQSDNTPELHELHVKEETYEERHEETQQEIRDKTSSERAERAERELTLQNEIASLTLENAILKEKIEVLSRQLSKFRSAIGDLTTIDIKADDQ